MGVKGKRALDSGETGGPEKGRHSDDFIRTFCLWRMHPDNILWRNIGFEEKKCRFMACQCLIISVILLYLLNCSYQKNKKPGKLHFNTVNWTTFWAHFSLKMFLNFHFTKAWTTRLKAQYSSSFSSYHCCQELQNWAPAAQDHNCFLHGQLQHQLLHPNPGALLTKHTSFPHWEFFTQQAWIGKLKIKKKKKEKEE